MKKFLGKKPVMISLVVVAVLMIALYIGMLVRPVAIGMTYKGEMSAGGQTAEMQVHFTSGSKCDTVIKVDGGSVEAEDIRYVAKGRKIYLIGEEMTNDEYKEAKKEILENWDELDEMGALTEINAFGFEDDGVEMKCAGSIVFAIVDGILTLAVVAFAGLAVAFSIKKK